MSLRGTAGQKISVLIVEDDADINGLLERIMRQQGYTVTQAFSGTEGRLRLFREQDAVPPGAAPYDLVLLDLMLPGLAGEDLLKEIRKKSEIPVIVLSAKSSLEDRVDVLNMGADDYLTKPFEKQEVIARTASVLRRYRRQRGAEAGSGAEGPAEGSDRKKAAARVCTFKNLSLDPEKRAVSVSGKPLSLTGHEFDILALLLRDPGRVYSRERLYEEVWQGGYYGEDNTVNVHVSNLRRKIAAADGQEYIKTVWGIGFKLAD